MVITEQEKPIRILTDRDIVIRVMANGNKAFDTKVWDVMTKIPYIVPEGIGIWELIKMMRKHAVRRFPIVSGDGKVVGIITMDDLIELIGAELSGLGSTLANELGHGDSMAA